MIRTILQSVSFIPLYSFWRVDVLKLSIAMAINHNYTNYTCETCGKGTTQKSISDIFCQTMCYEIAMKPLFNFPIISFMVT